MKTRNEKGQGLIEYLILVALIAVATMASIRFVGESMGVKFTKIAESLGARVDGTPRTPRVDSSAYRKKDMRNFMQGSVGRQRDDSSASDAD